MKKKCLWGFCIMAVCFLALTVAPALAGETMEQDRKNREDQGRFP